MKRSALLLFLLATSLFSFAKIWTVSNDDLTNADFTIIGDAVNAASSGDTIYVHGTAIYYGESLNIDKKLTLIGPGKYPNTPHKLTVGIRNIKFLAGSGGSALIGFLIYEYVTVGGADNVLIQGNYVDGGVAVVNSDASVIRDNVLFNKGNVNPYAINSTGGANTSTNLLIENNLVYSQLYQIHGATIRNNVFTRGINLFKTSNNNLLENNIFYGPNVRNCSACTFNNNLTFGASNDSLPATYSGSNNIIGQDPEFVNAPLSYEPTQFYKYDFHLKTSSPGVNAGTDGTNLGMFGSANPATNSGNANIPYISSAEVENSVVPAGGKVKVRIKSSKPE